METELKTLLGEFRAYYMDMKTHSTFVELSSFMKTNRTRLVDLEKRRQELQKRLEEQTAKFRQWVELSKQFDQVILQEVKLISRMQIMFDDCKKILHRIDMAAKLETYENTSGDEFLDTDDNMFDVGMSVHTNSQMQTDFRALLAEFHAYFLEIKARSTFFELARFMDTNHVRLMELEKRRQQLHQRLEDQIEKFGKWVELSNEFDQVIVKEVNLVSRMQSMFDDCKKILHRIDVAARLDTYENSSGEDLPDSDN